MRRRVNAATVCGLWLLLPADGTSSTKYAARSHRKQKPAVHENRMSKWYTTVAENTKEPVLKQAYKLAATVALRNLSLAQDLLRRAKKLQAKDETHQMQLMDLQIQGRLKARGALSRCPRGQDFLVEIQARQGRWQNTTTLKATGLWQAAINDKLIGFVYARSVGVRTPSVLGCYPNGILGLPRRWPVRWGCCFVLKPLYGFNGVGVILVQNGVDRISGWPVRGKHDVVNLLKWRGTGKQFTSRTYCEGSSYKPTIYSHLRLPSRLC
jgi:hypothetical protein